MFAFVWNKFQIVPQYLAQSKFGCSICSILFQYPDGNIPYFSIKIWMFQFWPSTKESPILEASNYHPILPCFILAIRWLHVQSRIRGHLQTNIWLFIVISLAKSKKSGKKSMENLWQNLWIFIVISLAKSMNNLAKISGKPGCTSPFLSGYRVSADYLDLPGLGPRRKMSWTLFAPRIWGNEWRVGCHVSWKYHTKPLDHGVPSGYVKIAIENCYL